MESQESTNNQAIKEERLSTNSKDQQQSDNQETPAKEKLCIEVAEDENSVPVSLNCEKDFILLNTVASQFPGASGLRYRSESKALHGVTFTENKFIAPIERWNIYYDSQFKFIFTIPHLLNHFQFF